MEQGNNISKRPWEKTLVICEDIDITLKNIGSLKLTFGKLEDYYIKCDMSEKILFKVSQISRALAQKHDNLNTLSSSVRYLLEALIQTELFLIEPDYLYKVYFSIYSQQINKLEKMIERIEYELSLLEEFDEKQKRSDATIKDSYGLNEADVDIVKKYIQELKNSEIIIDEEFDKHITIFCQDYKYFGFGFLKNLIEEQILKGHKDQLKKLTDIRTLKAKELVRKEFLTNLFDFKRQHSKVFDELKDQRSWHQKAQDAKLNVEYDLIYEYTSSLIHCTSYSFLTNQFINDSELQFNFNAMNQYMLLIHKNLRLLTDADKLNFTRVIID